ncbi:MAG: hypothetical protein R3E57_06325 [Porticoccaceae bacterium]
MKLDIDLLVDWKNILVNELKMAGYAPDQGVGVEDISFQYYYIKKREIVVSPRKVLRSDVFGCPADLMVGLSKFESEVTSGKNLNPYLSRGLRNLDYDDLLLNDWGIYHFHLGEKIESDGFVNRTGPLLFARVSDDTAYLINIFKHGGWSKKELIEIVHRNWPQSIEHYKVKGILGMASEINDDDHAQLRKSGISTFVEMSDGVIYGMLGGGYAMDGSSIEARTYSDRMLNLLVEIEEHAKNNVEEIARLVLENSSEEPSIISLNLDIDGDKIYLFEKSTNIRLLMYDGS